MCVYTDEGICSASAHWLGQLNTANNILGAFMDDIYGAICYSLRYFQDLQPLFQAFKTKVATLVCLHSQAKNNDLICFPCSFFYLN